jgi:hypothetical protein
MACQQHSEHGHKHGSGCGHPTVEHEGHVDYVHDGHLHNVHGDHVDEHRLAVGAANPSKCTPSHKCAEHNGNHTHGTNCGHQRIPHGDHDDYVVGTHLHHPHDGHCDDHGPMRMATA